MSLKDIIENSEGRIELIEVHIPRIYTDGNCGLSWDDSIITGMTPTPSARCPFEGFHVYPDLPGSTWEKGECEPLEMTDIPDDYEVTPTAEGGQE